MSKVYNKGYLANAAVYAKIDDTRNLEAMLNAREVQYKCTRQKARRIIARVNKGIQDLIAVSDELEKLVYADYSDLKITDAITGRSMNKEERGLIEL